MGRAIVKQNGKRVKNRQTVIERDGTLTYDATAPQIYGSTSNYLFDPDTDDAIMSLSFAGRYSPLLDWIGWEASLTWRLHKTFLAYAAPAGTSLGTPNSGRVSDNCAPGTPVEWGKCDFVISGFGKLRRATPVRSDDEDGLKYSDKMSLYRLDGTPITDDKEFDMRIVTAVLLEELQREIIVGNKTTAGSFDGLQRLVKYGYEDSEGEPCTAMDSIVINWKGLPLVDAESNDAAPETTITINGVAVADGTYNFYQFLMGAIRQIRIRIGAAPSLSGDLTQSDIALVCPISWAAVFMDIITCFNVCGGDVTRMDAFEARAYRNSLNGGLYGFGTIPIDGLTIPIIGYDYGLINADGTADAYFLVRGMGNTPFLKGQYKNNAPTVRNEPGYYATTDNNMLLTWSEHDNTCSRRNVQIQPRLVMFAPWSQIRFQNLPANGLFGVISSDPVSTFFIEQNLIPMVRAA